MNGGYNLQKATLMPVQSTNWKNWQYLPHRLVSATVTKSDIYKMADRNRLSFENFIYFDY